MLMEDEQYASSEDSDFAPDAAPAQEGESDQSDSEAEADDRPSKRRRTAAETNGSGNAGGGEDLGYDNSGDEAIIKKGEKKSKKRKDKSGQRTDKDDDDDEGGEGGLIKTRRQRAAEYGFSYVAASNISLTASTGKKSAR